MIGAYVFGFFIRYIPKKIHRQIYHMTYSLILLVLLLEYYWVVLAFINSLGVYLLMWKYPKKVIYTWVFSMTLLLILKCYDTYINWLTWGSPGPGLFMILICK